MAKVSVWLKIRTYLLNIAISFDQFAGSFIPGSYPDETISARCYRERWKTAEKLVNTLFRDPNHCKDAYLSERQRAHSPQQEKE